MVQQRTHQEEWYQPFSSLLPLLYSLLCNQYPYASPSYTLNTHYKGISHLTLIKKSLVWSIIYVREHQNLDFFTGQLYEMKIKRRWYFWCKLYLMTWRRKLFSADQRKLAGWLWICQHCTVLFSAASNLRNSSQTSFLAPRVSWPVDGKKRKFSHFQF